MSFIRAAGNNDYIEQLKAQPKEKLGVYIEPWDIEMLNYLEKVLASPEALDRDTRDALAAQIRHMFVFAVPMRQPTTQE
jgi:hypothetical protein